MTAVLAVFIDFVRYHMEDERKMFHPLQEIHRSHFHRYLYDTPLFDDHLIFQNFLMRMVIPISFTY